MGRSDGLGGKRVVVLGGTSGLGFAAAQAALGAGATVVVASSNKARVAHAVARLGNQAPQTVSGEVVDLADEPQMRALFERLGAFDHLVFTAGESLAIAPLASMTIADAKRFLDVRFWGAYMAAKYGSPHIRPGGSIVLTNGGAGLRPRKGWTVASSVCGAMESLTRALAVELAPIRVNCVCPGLVKTELWDKMSKADRQAMYAAASQRLLVGRPGEPDELADAYLYLMREGFSTGQVIVVDGGGVLV